jgi:hypothetical protein
MTRALGQLEVGIRVNGHCALLRIISGAKSVFDTAAWGVVLFSAGSCAELPSLEPRRADAVLFAFRLAVGYVLLQIRTKSVHLGQALRVHIGLHAGSRKHRQRTS